MYIKITAPKKVNKITCAKLVDYLEKENEKKDINEQQMFFNQSKEEISNQEVILKIDSNKACLGKEDDKYYMISINPSKNELKHICKEISGRDITEIKQLTKTEKKEFELKLKEYARNVMNEYAKNFNRGLSGNEILYYGKVEHERTYKRDNKQLLNERLKQAGFSKDSPDLPKIGDRKEGLQSHIHIVVSRKDISNTIKLSPFANARKALNKMPDGSESTIGFDRKMFSQKSEKAFDTKFNFKRDFNKSFQYFDIMKYQASKVTKNIAYRVMPKEMRTIGRSTEEAIRIIYMLNRPGDNIKIANTIKSKIPTLNFLTSSADLLKAQSAILSVNINDLGTVGNQLPNSFFAKNTELNSIVSERKTFVSCINKEISAEYKLLFAKQKELDSKESKEINPHVINVKKLQEQKLKLIAPYDEKINSIIEDKAIILKEKHITNDPNSIIHINTDTINRVNKISSDMEKISAKLSEIHSATDFLSRANNLSAGKLAESINNLKSKQPDIYQMIKSLDNKLKELYTAKNEIWCSVRGHRLLTEAQYDYILPKYEGKYLTKEQRTVNAEHKLLKVSELKNKQEEVKKVLSSKIEHINGTISDLKDMKENLQETAKVISSIDRAKDPLDIICTVFQHVPGAKECIKAINYAYNPSKILMDIGKKVLTTALNTGF